MKSHFSISEILRRCPSTFGQNGKGGDGWWSLRPQRRSFVCPARSKAAGVAKEVGPSSTFHAFSERGYNWLYSLAEWWALVGEGSVN